MVLSVCGCACMHAWGGGQRLMCVLIYHTLTFFPFLRQGFSFSLSPEFTFSKTSQPVSSRDLPVCLFSPCVSTWHHTHIFMWGWESQLGSHTYTCWYFINWATFRACPCFRDRIPLCNLNWLQTRQSASSVQSLNKTYSHSPMHFKPSPYYLSNLIWCKHYLMKWECYLNGYYILFREPKKVYTLH